MRTGIFSIAAMLMTGSAFGAPSDFDIAVLLAEDVAVGRACPLSEAEVLSTGGQTGIKVDDETFWVRTHAQASIPQLACARSAAPWRHLGSFKFVLTEPTFGVFLAPTISSDQIAKRKEALRASATSYLKRASCSEELKKLLNQIDGRRAQRAIDALFKKPPQRGNDIRCLVSQLTSEKPIVITSFAPPYPSWEGVYHAGEMRRRDLFEILLPHLLSYEISTDVRSDSVAHQRLVEAWAYWAACKAKDPLCLLPVTM